MLSPWLFTDDVKLDHLAEIGFSTIKLFLPLFPNCTLWKDITKCSPQLGWRWEEGVTHTPYHLERECLHQLFGILLQRRFAYSFFIYWVIYLFQCGHMDIYFIGWAITQYYDIYFVVQIVLALAIERTFSWRLCPFDILYHFLLRALSYFLTLQGTPGSSCIFPTLELVISLRNPESYIGQWC